jgi:predicted house-cleaning noncanonical NTP pyrophosphatase (MazG superfamily)
MTGEGILVRDCMKWKIEQVTPYVRPAKDVGEHLRLLRRKFLEEVGEVLEAEEAEEIAEELGDLLQVIIDYANITGVGMAAVRSHRVRKLRAKGGFDGGTVLAWKQPEE